jgi:hypothetical protein
MLKPALTILLAFVAGIVGAIIVARRPPTAPARLTATLDADAEGLANRAQLASVAAAGARRAAELEAEVSKLKAREPDAKPPSANPANRDPQQERQRELARHSELIDAHHQAARDASWAGPEETKLRDGYHELAAKLGFELGSVDCRTSTCVVDVRFPSTQAALKSLGDVGGLQDPKCGTRVTLPETPTPDEAVTAQVYIDCPRGS